MSINAENNLELKGYQYDSYDNSDKSNQNISSQQVALIKNMIEDCFYQNLDLLVAKITDKLHLKIV